MSDVEGRAATRAAGRVSLGRTALAGVGAAALAAVASGQTWATATVTSPATRSADAKGSDVAPLALALALVALAAWGSILVLRRTGRRVVAVLGLAASAGAVAAVLVSRGEEASVARAALGVDGGTVTSSAWPWVAAVASLLAAATFVGALRRAGTWPEMSKRYDAPGTPGADGDGGAAAGPGETSDRAMWRALDEGRDPTA